MCGGQLADQFAALELSTMKGGEERIRERLRVVPSRGSSPALMALLSCVLVLTACRPQKPTTTYEPTIVGVVRESNAGYDETIKLDDGQTLEVADGRSLTESRPSGGELFLGGTDQRGMWFQDARPGPADCPFGISSNAWDDGAFVILESGLRLSERWWPDRLRSGTGSAAEDAGLSGEALGLPLALTEGACLVGREHQPCTRTACNLRLRQSALHGRSPRKCGEGRAVG